MAEAGRRKRTKWVQLIAACALLLMLAPFAQKTDREAWLSKAFQVSAAAAEVPSNLCERYADAAGRIVDGWYPSAFDRVGYGGLIGALSEPLEIPTRTVRWRCAARELSLELDLPEDDEAGHQARVVLKDILSSLPSLGLDPIADEMKIAVTLQSGDSASFEPGTSSR